MPSLTSNLVAPSGHRDHLLAPPDVPLPTHRQRRHRDRPLAPATHPVRPLHGCQNALKLTGDNSTRPLDAFTKGPFQGRGKTQHVDDPTNVIRGENGPSLAHCRLTRPLRHTRRDQMSALPRGGEAKSTKVGSTRAVNNPENVTLQADGTYSASTTLHRPLHGSTSVLSTSLGRSSSTLTTQSLHLPGLCQPDTSASTSPSPSGFHSHPEQRRQPDRRPGLQPKLR